MIRFSLRCSDGHQFDSWFQSAEAYDTLAAAGHVACIVCGSKSVEKAIMAPRVRPGRNRAEGTETAGKGALSTPASPAEQALAALRQHVETHSEYVGTEFAREARAMHEGEREARPIHGEARAEDARRLIKDGVPVAPLPFLPGRKTN